MMKKELFFAAFAAVLFSACGPQNREDQLVSDICQYYEPYAATREEMKAGYRAVFSTIDTRRNRFEFKRNYWMDEAFADHATLKRYLDKNLPEEQAQKKFNALHNLLVWELEQWNQYKPLDAARIHINKLTFKEYTLQSHQLIGEAINVLQRGYTRHFNDEDRKRDKTITRVLKEAGKDKYTQEYSAPENTRQKLNEFYEGASKAIFSAIEEDGNIINKKLVEKVRSNCSGADQILF